MREASKRVLGMRPFDVQLVGGIVLHEGDIAEMKTGEGKTLVAVLPMYLNALEGKGAHLVTVNDYLAKRDAEWMGGIYRFLGLEVGVVQAMMPSERGREAYGADITYGTNTEFGFDYLRDNMAMRLDDCVQRGHHLLHRRRGRLDPRRRGAYAADHQRRARDRRRHLPQVRAHRAAAQARRRLRGRREAAHGGDHRVGRRQGRAGDSTSTTSTKTPTAPWSTTSIQALRAESLYHKDVEYVVQNGEVLIVDEFTGRILEGRRYSEGLHQAIEAKESVPIREENQTLATITLQNYFRLYGKLAGMTGTAKTEEEEFQKIYGLSVVEIPTNAEMVRNDANDFIFTTTKEKHAPSSTTSSARHESRPAGARRHRVGRGLGAARRRCSNAAACRTTCSTPSSTSARPR